MEKTAAKTADLIDELLVSSPKAIAYNAVRLGLMAEGDTPTRQALIQAVAEKRDAEKLNPHQTARLMCQLLSVESAHKSLASSLFELDTEGGKMKMLPEWVGYLLAILALIGLVVALAAIGRAARKIIS